MLVKHISMDGKESTSGSLTNLLHHHCTDFTPDLDGRMQRMRCPDHGCRLTGITMREIIVPKETLSGNKSAPKTDSDFHAIVFEFHAPCHFGKICTVFEDYAVIVFEQDRERSVEFVGHGLNEQW